MLRRMPPTREVQAQSPALVLHTIQTFLAEWPDALVLEDGKTLFDLRHTQYTLDPTHGRCTLHLWGEAGNLVRRIVAAEPRNKSLRLQVIKFGQTKPTLLELAGDRERRTPSTREGTRTRFVKVLERALLRQFGSAGEKPWKPEGFRTAMDLEQSFGPAYARGLLVQGQKAWAVIAVNAEESPATIDGILTFGILWLELQRNSATRRGIVGLKVIIPTGSATLTLSRMPWLRDPASWQLWELDQREETLTLRDPADHGNLSTRLVHAPGTERARQRFERSAGRIRSLIPEHARPVVEERLRSSTELAFLLHGLDFARVRLRAGENFNRLEEITVGAGASETPLTPETESDLRDLIAQLCARRHPEGDRRDLLFRMQPERWLEGELRRELHRLDDTLRPEHTHAQVPAFAAGDRGMLDLLSVDHDGRLAVLEIKADEDPQLALQGLDYWIRVRFHHAQNSDSQTGQQTALGEFQRHGYFGGIRLSPANPRLLLVAPALRIHPATETILRHLSPQVEWTLAALNESWRRGLQVVWRKRSTDHP